MDKKMRSHRRASSSSSSSSSSASSFTSSSSSSSSFGSRRAISGRARTGGGSVYKEQSRSKKFRSGERAKTKKTKRSSSLIRKHGSSKSSARKASHGHASRKEYKDVPREYAIKEHPNKDYENRYKNRSPLHHHRRSATSKKSISPAKRAFSPIGRKARKRSPSPHKKAHRRSVSPRERADYHHTLSPSRPRDPRIERALKKSPEFAPRDARYRYERDPYEEKRSDDREKKLLKDRISFKDRFISTDRDSDRDEGRFSRDGGYSCARSYESERDIYARVESRDSSLERKTYEDPYERFERERTRIENRNRIEELSHERIAVREYATDPREDRRRQLSMEGRYADDRRKASQSMWPDDPRNPSGSMMDRLQEPESRVYSHHRRSGDWPPEAHGRRVHETGNWEKHLPPKRRAPEWTNEYSSGEWRDRAREWEPSMDDHATEWHPRRYHSNWTEGDRGEWGGNVRKRVGVRSPNLVPPATRQIAAIKKDTSLPMAEPVASCSNNEDTPHTKPEDKSFTPKSPSKQSSQEGKTSPAKEEKGELAAPAEEQVTLETETFSDFSDDSDGILNQEPVVIPAEENTEASLTDDNKVLQGDVTSYDDVMEEERMDLEEISDDDFEEEKQVKYSVANALDIDWSTLKVDPSQQLAVNRTSAVKRFSTLNILSRLGVSSKYARKEFLDELVDKCYQMEIDAIKSKKAAADKAKAENALKLNAEPTDDAVKMEIDVKSEPLSDEDAEQVEESMDQSECVPDELPQILPVVISEGVLKHVRHANLKRSRVFYLGRKALCSTDDVIIRRRLCHLPEDEMLFEKPQFSKELFVNALSLLQA